MERNSMTRTDRTTIRQLVGISLLVSAIVGYSLVLFYFPDQQVAILRYSLITLFSTLPAIMYFIFIAWRKTSLFQEYISNLHRLGLLNSSAATSPGNTPTGTTCFFNQVQVHGYVQRFEGVYGPINEEITEELINTSGNSEYRSQPSSSALLGNQSAGQIFSVSTAMPVFVATSLIAIGWFLYLPPQEYSGEPADLMAVLAVNPNPILYGFIGAYFFSLQMLYRRFVTNDLRAKAFIGVSMRIVLSILGAWILFMILAVQIIDFSTETFALLAFVIGAFPTVLWRMARTAASKFTGQWLPFVDSVLPVRELDGLSVWHQARLEEEDIENTYNMANADIIDLLLHTRIPADRAIDWVDQAILLSTIGPDSEDSAEYKNKRAKLKHYGILSASAITDAYRRGSGFTDISLTRLQLQKATDDDLGLISASATAAQNFSNLQLVNNWKVSVNIPGYNEIIQPTQFSSASHTPVASEPA